MTTDTSDMVFRSVYVDPDVDKSLRERASQLGGVREGDMFRRVLQDGMGAFRAGARRPPLHDDKKVALTLRTVFVPIDLDEELRVEAFHLRTTKMNLIRQLLRMGMREMQEG